MPRRAPAELPFSEPAQKAPKLDDSAIVVPPAFKKIRRAKSIVAWDRSDAMSIAPSIASKAAKATNATRPDAKANSIRIFDKVQICKRYDELKARGDIVNVV